MLRNLPLFFLWKNFLIYLQVLFLWSIRQTLRLIWVCPQRIIYFTGIFQAPNRVFQVLRNPLGARKSWLPSCWWISFKVLGETSLATSTTTSTTYTLCEKIQRPLTPKLKWVCARRTMLRNLPLFLIWKNFLIYYGVSERRWDWVCPQTIIYCTGIFQAPNRVFQVVPIYKYNPMHCANNEKLRFILILIWVELITHTIRSRNSAA